MAKKAVKKDSEKKVDYDLIAYIIGIVAIVQSFISPSSGLVLGIIGLVFSNRLNSEMSRKARKLNTIAIIVGAILFIIIAILSFTTLGAYIQQ